MEAIDQLQHCGFTVGATALKNLLREMEKQAHDLGRKMDKANLKCLEIKNTLRK